MAVCLSVPSEFSRAHFDSCGKISWTRDSDLHPLAGRFWPFLCTSWARERASRDEYKKNKTGTSTPATTGCAWGEAAIAQWTVCLTECVSEMAWFVCQRQASRERSKINAVDTCVSGKVLLVKGSTSLHHYLHLCRFDEADTDTEGNAAAAALSAALAALPASSAVISHIPTTEAWT